MPVHIIRVIRELTDMGFNPLARSESYFYKDVDRFCPGKWEPNTDILETDNEVIIRVELAGVIKEDISVKIKNGELAISGIRHPLKPENQTYFHQLEIDDGEFEKVIAIPHSIEHNEVTAYFQDGLLEIRISKEDQAVEIPISIEAKATDQEE